MPQDETTIYVYLDQDGDVPILLGCLFVSVSRGRSTFSFTFDEDWMRNWKGTYQLDPDLHLYHGRQYLHQSKPLWGIFSDSCPDRWGRMLLQRKEAMLAAAESRKPKTLYEQDYLLGVSDMTRMGALRFSLQKDGPFFAESDENDIPPWVSLRKLEAAARTLEEGGADENNQLMQLLDPGSSLGGARPKANVYAPDNSLWIAKFPSGGDDFNVGAWEKVANDLARLCGLRVPETKLENYSDHGATFLAKRFDRDGQRRIHFASAMTMLGRTDEENDAGYLDIASFICSNALKPVDELRELWKRIAFNILINNTEDHLQNHGFLLKKNGWELSPVYDINPIPYGDHLALRINEYDNRIDETNFLDTSRYYKLSKTDATSLYMEMKRIVRDNWEPIAGSYFISHAEIERMRPAFSLAET